jgi:hypothetical protein
LASIKADRKIALTGTPIQNNKNEIGLMFLFLNEYRTFEILIKYYKKLGKKDNFGSEQEKAIKLRDKLLDDAVNNCIEKDAIFHFFGESRAQARILSLPINSDMYFYAREILGKNKEKQRMYFSSPSSISINTLTEEKVPLCTKEVAVSSILKSMLSDEKAIIFSLNKNVLYSYYDICKKNGFPANVITGEDKGEILNEKLRGFKGNKFRVLLTTLQKSSESSNFDFATHIIILEFWWNPQKIFQAMARTDRRSQERKTYTYLLCYNINGALIPEEKVIYQTMDDKNNIANEIYKEVLQIHNQKLSKNNISLYERKLPKIEVFTNIESIEQDVNNFLCKFHIQEPIKELIGSSRETKSIDELRMEEFYHEEQKYILFDKLLNFPWEISFRYIKKNLQMCYSEILNDIQIQKLDEKINYIDFARDTSYLNQHFQVIFITILSFQLNGNNHRRRIVGLPAL